MANAERWLSHVSENNAGWLTIKSVLISGPLALDRHFTQPGDIVAHWPCQDISQRLAAVIAFSHGQGTDTPHTHTHTGL